jgi:hypothetical protein
MDQFLEINLLRAEPRFENHAPLVIGEPPICISRAERCNGRNEPRLA